MERRLNRRKFLDPDEQNRWLLEEAIRNNKNAKLERVLGCTACSSSIAVDHTTGLVAYPAGSTVVIQNTRTHAQAHLVSSSKNNITCLAFSPDGHYIVTGEYGCDPMVRVWELQRDGQNFGQQIAELKDHKIGIVSVIFSNDCNQVISVGNQHDKSVVVWDWRSQQKITEGRLSSQVNAMAINDTGKMFVTVGARHVKFWFLELENNQRTTLQGRSAILLDQRNNTFIDVCFAPENRSFAITLAKHLVEFHDKKLVNTYEMNGGIPYSLTTGCGYLFVGFGNGRIRALDLNTVDFAFEFPLPHYLKMDIAAGDSAFDSDGDGLCYPDVHSLVFHEQTRVLTAFYSDRSVYHWQLLPSNEIAKVSSNLFHVGTVHDVAVVKSGQTACLPVGTFFTCGADETVRMWNIDRDLQPGAIPANIFSNELRKILYLNQNGVTSLTEQHGKNFGGIMADTLETTVGVRCLRLNSDGRNLATGSRNGNVAIFDLTTFELIGDPIEAHESEVRCLEYSSPQSGHNFLASGSRDRLVHLFDADNGYNHLCVIEDHSSTIYSVSFIPSLNGLQMITCSTDKLVVVRRLAENGGEMSFERVKQLNVKSGPNHLVVTGDNNLLTVGADRHLRTYSLSGKELSDVNGTLCDSGTLTKVALDPSGTYAATVCSDRYVYVVDVANGDCVAVLSGQCDGITSIEFTSDCRLSSVLTKRMVSRLARSSLPAVHRLTATDADRCPTPDSLIESGSDSASAIVTKKDARGGSEFGSLNSLNVAQEDDLDSGVGLRSQPTVFSSRSPVAEQQSFVLKKVPVEVTRRSSSNLHAALTASNGDLNAASSEVADPDAEMLHQPPPYVNSHQPGPFPIPTGYTSSRSMSNIHRHAVSPQRTRRRWNMGEGTPEERRDTMYAVMPPIERPPPQMPAQMQHPNEALMAPRFQMNTSISLNAIRGSMSPQDQRPNSRSTIQPSPLLKSATNYQRRVEDSFDRNGHSRNSISKRYLNHVGDPNDSQQTVWSPMQLKQRRSSNLFSPAANNSSSPRRLNNDDREFRRLFESRLRSPEVPKLFHSPPRRKNGATRLFNRLQQQRPRRQTRDETELPTATASEMFQTLRSRSQSPSHLALQMANPHSRKLSSTLQRRRDSDAVSTRTSRSNLRAASNLSTSSQALHKLMASRDQLKKSQENLLLAVNGDMADGGENSMSRSRSIGNLKLTTARPATGANNTFGGLTENELNYQMTRSVSNVQNTLNNAFEGTPHGGLGQSIRNLSKLSNPDLTNETLYDEPEKHSSTGESTHEPSVSYSTLQRNVRKGAVQKRLERSNPRGLRVDQTTSGDSDSNASDIPSGSFTSPLSTPKSAMAGSRTPNQFRTLSSVDSAAHRGRVAVTKRAPNYFAQRLNNGGEMSEPTNDETANDLKDSEFTTPNARNMSKHARECIEQMQRSCDKLLQARQMIESDSSITDGEREKLLRFVHKAINASRLRLESALPDDRTFSDMTNVESLTNGGSGSLRNNTASGGRLPTSDVPSTSSNQPELNADFLRRYGPQLMQLLQENMSRTN